jgi:hypothetical protein
VNSNGTLRYSPLCDGRGGTWVNQSEVSRGDVQKEVGEERPYVQGGHSRVDPLELGLGW